MSRKSFVLCVGLILAIAASAQADPTMSVDMVRDGGGLAVLDASGNWQWIIRVTPDAALFNVNPANDPVNPGGSLAVELGFAATVAGSGMTGIVKNATNFPFDNNGSPLGGAFPTGDGVERSGNNAIAFLGSDYFITATAKDAVTITTVGPSTAVAGSLSSTLVWSGAYGGMGRISQDGMNFTTFAGSQTNTAFGGDVNLSGDVGPADASILGINWLQTLAGGWKVGDFNRDGSVGPADASVMGINWLMDQPGAPPGAGSGGLSVVEIPEPTSMTMVVMAVALCGWLARRKR